MDMRYQYLDGVRVKGNYQGTIVTGTVTSSRMRYQEMIHYVDLDTPFSLRLRDTPVWNVILGADSILEVL
jgi:hypothetical protein